jgi:hypothetical protein
MGEVYRAHEGCLAGQLLHYFDPQTARGSAMRAPQPEQISRRLPRLSRTHSFKVLAFSSISYRVARSTQNLGPIIASQPASLPKEPLL